MPTLRVQVLGTSFGAICCEILDTCCNYCCWGGRNESLRLGIRICSLVLECPLSKTANKQTDNRPTRYTRP